MNELARLASCWAPLPVQDSNEPTHLAELFSGPWKCPHWDGTGGGSCYRFLSRSLWFNLILTLNQRWASAQEEEVSPPSEVGLQGPESLRLWNEDEKKKMVCWFCSRCDERLCVVTTAVYQEFIKRCVHWHAVCCRNNHHSSFSTSSLSSHDECLSPFSFSFSSLTGSDWGKRETVLLPELDKSLLVALC